LVYSSNSKTDKSKKEMKAILEFDLNEMDDSMAHKRCAKATDMAIALWEIAYNTKKRIGYEMDD